MNIKYANPMRLITTSDIGVLSSQRDDAPLKGFRRRVFNHMDR